MFSFSVLERNRKIEVTDSEWKIYLLLKKVSYTLDFHFTVLQTSALGSSFAKSRNLNLVVRKKNRKLVFYDL